MNKELYSKLRGMIALEHVVVCVACKKVVPGTGRKITG